MKPKPMLEDGNNHVWHQKPQARQFNTASQARDKTLLNQNCYHMRFLSDVPFFNYIVCQIWSPSLTYIPHMQTSYDVLRLVSWTYGRVQHHESKRVLLCIWQHTHIYIATSFREIPHHSLAGPWLMCVFYLSCSMVLRTGAFHRVDWNVKLVPSEVSRSKRILTVVVIVMLNHVLWESWDLLELYVSWGNLIS